MSPRRTRPAPRKRRHRHDVSEAPAPSYDSMARDLVRRGLASNAVLRQGTSMPNDAQDEREVRQRGPRRERIRWAR